MTDGTIQQVFNEWREGIIEYMDNNKKTRFDRVTDLKYEDIFSALSMREQELIERIKQEIEQYHNAFGDQILQKLIGDSKE